MIKRILLFEKDPSVANTIIMRLPRDLECLVVRGVIEVDHETAYFTGNKIVRKIPHFNWVQAIVLNFELGCEQPEGSITSCELILNWQSDGFRNPIFLLYASSSEFEKATALLKLFDLEDTVTLIHSETEFTVLQQHLNQIASQPLP